MEKEVLVTFAWVTWPERPKCAKDDVKSPEGPPAGSQGPEGPKTSSITKFHDLHMYGIQFNMKPIPVAGSMSVTPM